MAGWDFTVFRLGLLAIACFGTQPAVAESAPAKCTDAAMLVFDGSGSMAGTDMNSVTPRIQKVRDALEAVLPEIAPQRELGLITYGPGSRDKCTNIELNVRPGPDTSAAILDVVRNLIPYGGTPLTRAVELAAEALDYRNREAVIVLLTDGEETCGGSPCALAKRLKEEGKATTVHIIGYRTAISGTSGIGMLETRCLPDTTGGTYTSVETKDELIAALRSTLGCPQMTSPAPSLDENRIHDLKRELVDLRKVVDVGQQCHR